jgi:drug/metabolite transporter (DMT)-like permease
MFLNINPTLIGSLAILIWGVALPFERLVIEEIGVYSWIGVQYGISGIVTLMINWRSRPIKKAYFMAPTLYGRWIFFILHIVSFTIAIGIVSRDHISFLILLNYLWPTAIIVSSIFVAGIKVKRVWAFLLGTLIVLLSLAIEIIGSKLVSVELFQSSRDCIAYILAVFGAISWGLYSSFSKRSGDSSGAGTVIPLFQLTLGLALPLSYFEPFYVPWHLTFNIAILAIVFSLLQVVAFQSWDHGMRKGNIVALSLFADFIPWLSLFSASLFLHFELGVHTVLSAVCLVAGAMVTRYGVMGQVKT